MSDDFYVGYLDKAPAPLASWLRLRVVVLVLLFLLVGLGVVVSQGQFAPGSFEFGQEQTFSGTLFRLPYPMLRLDRPGQVGDFPDHSLYYLGVFGKRGASEATRGLNCKKVRLRGALIYRDNQVMIEMVDGSLEVLGEGERPDDRPLGTLTVAGEIVDSKCFLGVMKPGNLKTHKTCAIRCIAGGVPPVLLVRDEQGTAHYFLLATTDGSRINHKILDMVAEPVLITGEVYQRDNLLMLRADPESYKLLKQE